MSGIFLHRIFVEGFEINVTIMSGKRKKRVVLMACLRWLLVRAWECHVFICVEVKNGVDSNSFTKKELMMIIFVIIIYCNYFWHYNSFLNFYGQHNNFYIYVFLYRYDNLKFIFLNLFILFHFIGKLLFVISLFLLVLYIFNISLFVCLFGALQGDSVCIFFSFSLLFPLAILCEVVMSDSKSFVSEHHVPKP